MKTLLIPILIAAAALAAQAAPQISAELQPDEIALGQSSRLVVTISGSETNERPEVPQVDGLDIRPAGQSQQIRIINGQTSSSLGFTYRVTPDRAGEFEIPAIKYRNIRSEALKFTVKKSSNATPRALGSPGSVAAPTPSDTAGLAFLRIDRADNGDRDHLYVGELTPIAIRAFFREGVEVSQISKPSLASGAFTLHQISDEPQQQSTTIDGQSYRVLTWLAGLSGVKAADEKLEATLQATIGIPQQRQAGQLGGSRSPFGNSLFDDPFFDRAFDGFFQPVERREVTLSNEPMPLAVKTLPAEDRPAGFDGAVGQFKLGSFSIPTELETGDPVDLKITVTGKGNFDRVTAPNILPADQWKTYSAKDEIEPADSIGYEAEKSFTLPAIALKPGNMDVGFSFDYFDPESGKYKSINSQQIPVEVTGSAVSVAESVVADAPEQRPADALAPLRDDPGRAISNPKPLYLRTWFLVAQSVPASALLAALAIGIVRRRNDDPVAQAHRQTQGAINDQLEQLATARQKQDGAAFFIAARRALRFKLAEHWQTNAEAITSEEVGQRLPKDSSSARVFAMADCVEFSGARPHPDSFGEWERRVKQALEEIDSSYVNEQSESRSTWGEISAA